MADVGLVFKGMAFPFQKGATGLPAAAGDADLIKQSLIQIIQTGRGERVMRPNFGSGAMSFVFEPNDIMLQTLISSDIGSAIATWEPRVLVRNIIVTKDGDDQVLVTINYFVPSTNTLDQVTTSLATVPTT